MNKNKSYQDSIYGNFSYPAKLEQFIRSKPVLRLYRIKQLGLLEQVYPSGDGNRFSHSIGVMFLMGEFLEILCEKRKNKKVDDWKEVAMLCGLLHDIGHGPFSHSFESISKIPHEAWTIKIIDQYYLKHIKDPLMKKRLYMVLNIFKKTYLKSKDKSILPKNKGDKWFFYLICSLLSGPFDLDKLDYLLRDNSSLGFGYNTVDFDWLKQCIGYKFNIDHPDKSFIYFEEDACTALDEFIFHRIAYYWKCIFHRKVRLFAILHKHLFQFLGEKEERYKNIPDNLKRIFKFTKFPKNPLKEKAIRDEDVEDFLSLDDCFMWEFIKFLNKEVKKQNKFFTQLSPSERKLIEIMSRPFIENTNEFHCLCETFSGHDGILNDSDREIRKQVKKNWAKTINSQNDDFISFLYFYDSPALLNHIKKENTDIKIKSRQKKVGSSTESDFFNLLERSQIQHLFIKGTLARRYYIASTEKESDTIQKKILGFSIDSHTDE